MSADDVTPVCLRAEDAVELGELLEFLGDLLERAGDDLGALLTTTCGAGYTVEDLRVDVARFAFLLVGDERFVSGEGW